MFKTAGFVDGFWYNRHMLIGYARVSTADQDPQLQIDALRAAGVERLFTDHASGAATSRPEFDQMMQTVRAGDTVMVWRLDRLGRSMRHLLELVSDFEAREVGLRSLHEQLDTTTANGRLIFHVMAALAEFERGLLAERTQAGLEAARRKGRVGGRPRALTAAAAQAVVDLRNDGKSVAEIAETLRVSRATVYRELEALNASASD